jgi:hypothetical protein
MNRRLFGKVASTIFLPNIPIVGRPVSRLLGQLLEKPIDYEVPPNVWYEVFRFDKAEPDVFRVYAFQVCFKDWSPNRALLMRFQEDDTNLVPLAHTFQDGNLFPTASRLVAGGYGIPSMLVAQDRDVPIHVTLERVEILG